jgi:hypothetical protein
MPQRRQKLKQDIKGMKVSASSYTHTKIKADIMTAFV